MTTRTVCQIITHPTLAGIVLVLLIALTAVTGCTESVQPVQPVTTPLVTETPAPHTSQITAIVSVTSQPVTTVQVTVTESPIKIFNGEYHWAEYRINETATFPPNPRKWWEYDAKIERSYEVHDGVPAIHEKTTVTCDAFHENENYYFERSTKRFLGGTIDLRLKGEGVDRPTEIVPADKTYHGGNIRSWLIILPFENFNISLTFNGVESVTVPAGTFPNARKYSGKFFEDDAPITFWVSEGVPVPVQYRFLNPDREGIDPVQMFELRDWG